jgi:hypothetical protein
MMRRRCCHYCKEGVSEELVFELVLELVLESGVVSWSEVELGLVLYEAAS